MKYNEVTTHIMQLGRDVSLTFSQKGAVIASALQKCTPAEILDHLDYAGIIPECVGHDSTEEKLFAKFCDALVARALGELGLKSKLIDERADAADVIAETDSYSIVADAKAFRLSRTAKNQKDFKVEALSSWKKDADYACLVAPLYQYPTRNSQIYRQAAAENVSLLSYTHLAFLIRKQVTDPNRLRALWDAPMKVGSAKDAVAYWHAVNTEMLNVAQTNKDTWEQEMAALKKRLPEQAREQIAYWEAEKIRIYKLPHDEAVEELIVALKIDAKVRTIQDAVGEIPEAI